MRETMSGQYQKRTVRIEIDLPMEFPKEWDDKLINFHLNESSWCFSNIIEMLEEYEKQHGCICRICKGKVYETTKEREEGSNERKTDNGNDL